jgi:hypothetical protein
MTERKRNLLRLAVVHGLCIRDDDYEVQYSAGSVL